MRSERCRLHNSSDGWFDVPNNYTSIMSPVWALWKIAISLEYLHCMGPEIMSAEFHEISRENVGKEAKSVFWGKVEMAENLSWRKWVWPIWGDASGHRDTGRHRVKCRSDEASLKKGCFPDRSRGLRNSPFLLFHPRAFCVSALHYGCFSS